jgi:EAL domain-containing protein (putative c-di-GMP-specific phosphodiesterase class I)
MYCSKHKGKNTYTFYKSELHRENMVNIKLENQLKKAIEHDEFHVVYQPQIDIKKNKVVGFEALLRWNNSIFGNVPPTKFISIAEQSDLIIDIGTWVTQQVCIQIYKWADRGVDVRVGINVSAVQLTRSCLYSIILELINELNIAPNMIDLELTESVLIENEDEILRVLNGFSDLGVSLSIDDFGMGYSNLTYLQRFPINRIKIDRSFIHEIYNEKNQHIVRAIVEIARSLDITVLCEGVETVAQYQILLDLGCDEIQGFYFSEPLHAFKAEKYYKKFNIKDYV